MSRKSDLGTGESVREFPQSQPRSPFPSASVILAYENERKRLSRELHDEIGQGLMTLRLSLGSLVKDAADDEVRVRAKEALSIVDHTIEGLRRIIGRFSPKTLEDMGMLGAIRREAELLSKQTGINSHLALPNKWSSMDHEVEIAIYRSVQEALHNISKHSRARNFSVELDHSGKRLSLRITDDGVGFPVKVNGSRETFGITGMRERVEEVGGTLQIAPLKKGGTRIHIEIPDRSAVADPDLTVAQKAS